MTTPVTTQGSTGQGMSAQQPFYPPGFPPPLGMEQYFGQLQQYGAFPQQLGPQQYGGIPQQYSVQSQFPGQQQLWGQQVPIQQIVQTLASQLLPAAQQIILPQVVATATQQIAMCLQQFVAHQVSLQLAQQGGWHSQFAPYGQIPFGRPSQGSF